jgi:hypothetical protein
MAVVRPARSASCQSFGRWSPNQNIMERLQSQFSASRQSGTENVTILTFMLNQEVLLYF